MEPEEEAKLRHGLIDLHWQVTLQREAGVDSDKITKTLGTFEDTWLDRIDSSERTELRGSKSGIVSLLAEQDRQAKIERDIRDNVAMKTMDMESQNYYAHSNRSSGNPYPRQEEERALLTDIAYGNDRIKIQGRYEDLRGGMQQAVRDMKDGKEPDLSFLLAQQMTKEQDMAEKAQPNKDIVKDALAQLKAIEAKRHNAKKREFSKEMER